MRLKITKKKNFLQNMAFYTPIERSHRVMIKYDVFDLIWIYVPIKLFKKLGILNQVLTLKPDIFRMKA